MKSFVQPVFSLALACISGLVFSAVDINTATQAQLEALRDLGPVKAKAIVTYRGKHGHFKSLDELKKVPGIGELTLKKIKTEVSVGELGNDKVPSRGAHASPKTVRESTKP